MSSGKFKHVILLGIFVLLIISVIYAMSLYFPKYDEFFFELAVLGIEGKAADYPKELAIGEEGVVTVGIVNHEHEPVTYRIEVIIDGDKNKEVGPVGLEHNEKWEGITAFTPNEPGENQKVEFLLYRQGQTDVYQSLHLWVDVM